MGHGELRIALVGGVPPLLGGGGLELQLQRTGAGLRALGHDARPVHEWGPDDPVDIVHAFNHGGDIVHYLDHWRRSPAAFVLTPVIVAEESRAWRLKAGRHLPIPAFPARAIRTMVRKADVIVSPTRWEGELVQQLSGVGPERIAIIGNGADPTREVDAGELPELPATPFAVSVGAVSHRKGQLGIAHALARHQIPYVVIGGAHETDPDEIATAVAATGGTWLRELHDSAVIRAIVARAAAHIQFSRAEGQSLAVMEALSAGTPVIGSNIPSHRELAQELPQWVSVCDSPAHVADAFSRRVSRPTAAAPPKIPTWTGIAEQHLEPYARALSMTPRTGQNR